MLNPYHKYMLNINYLWMNTLKVSIFKRVVRVHLFLHC